MCLFSFYPSKAPTFVRLAGQKNILATLWEVTPHTPATLNMFVLTSVTVQPTLAAKATPT